MRILIDGYNLLHASTVTPSRSAAGTLEATRNALLDFLIAKLPADAAAQTTVVFDSGTERGLPDRSKYGPLEIRFAINHPEADDLIEDLVRAHSAPKNLTVVSSDHRIQRAAKRRKARPVDSERWLTELTINSRRDTQKPDRTAGAVADWQNEFADIDLEQIEREFAAEDNSSTHKPSDVASPRPADPKSASDRPSQQPNEADDESLSAGENPFPPGYGEDQLDNEDYESPFPPGYGEDLLDDL